MVQPFCSVYTKSYRAYDIDTDNELPKPCTYFSDLKENFLSLDDSKTIYNAERDEALLKEMRQKRLYSTYQKSYCSSEGKKSMMIDPDNLDADQFVAAINNYYAEKTQPVPRPLNTLRRVFGYCRFENYYTGKSEYEETISRNGYEYFKKQYDEGKSRLFGNKQKTRHKPIEEKSSDKEDSQEKLMENPDSKTQKTCTFCCQKFNDYPNGQTDESALQEEEEEIKSC